MGSWSKSVECNLTSISLEMTVEREAHNEISANRTKMMGPLLIFILVLAFSTARLLLASTTSSSRFVTASGTPMLNERATQSAVRLDS